MAIPVEMITGFPVAAAAATGKPVIISTGMATLGELELESILLVMQVANN